MGMKTKEKELIEKLEELVYALKMSDWSLVDKLESEINVLKAEQSHSEPLKQVIEKLRKDAIKSQEGWNFPNEIYIECTGIIMACDQILEWMESDQSQEGEQPEKTAEEFKDQIEVFIDNAINFDLETYDRNVLDQIYDLMEEYRNQPKKPDQRDEITSEDINNYFIIQREKIFANKRKQCNMAIEGQLKLSELDWRILILEVAEAMRDGKIKPGQGK
jgi:hypothetical protein